MGIPWGSSSPGTKLPHYNRPLPPPCHSDGSDSGLCVTVLTGVSCQNVLSPPLCSFPYHTSFSSKELCSFITNAPLHTDSKSLTIRSRLSISHASQRILTYMKVWEHVLPTPHWIFNQVVSPSLFVRLSPSDTDLKMVVVMMMTMAVAATITTQHYSTDAACGLRLPAIQWLEPKPWVGGLTRVNR